MHIIRHTWRTWLTRTEASFDAARKTIGHSSVSKTMDNHGEVLQDDVRAPQETVSDWVFKERTDFR